MLKWFAINTEQNDCCRELLSAEGTTQGDSLSMAFYAISLVPLMSKLNEASEGVQCWLADEASCSGKVKATFHLTISMREQRAMGKIQRNHYHHGSCGSSLTL